MRLYLTLTKNSETIPFNYQPYFTGAIHKWIGRDNPEHDEMSLYSFSWLQNITTRKSGIDLTPASYFFISAHNEQLIKRILKGIMQDPSICCGSAVLDVQITNAPSFERTNTFFAASPIFVKRRFNNNEKHITYENPSSSEYLTETLKKKLQAANLSGEGLHVKFDETYLYPRTKIIRYNNIGNKVNLCPVVVQGTQEQLQFAWNVGVGNSTGIGFGALK